MLLDRQVRLKNQAKFGIRNVRRDAVSTRGARQKVRPKGT